MLLRPLERRDAWECDYSSVAVLVAVGHRPAEGIVLQILHRMPGLPFGSILQLAVGVAVCADNVTQICASLLHV
jgi:hypothetical protein